MSLIIFFGILAFVGFFLIALFMLPRSSAQSALLDEVTRQAREVQNPAPRHRVRALTWIGWPNLSPSSAVCFPVNPIPTWSGA